MRSRGLLKPHLLRRLLLKPTVDPSAQRSYLSSKPGQHAPEPAAAAADPARAASLLAERDWFARLNAEFAAPVQRLGPRLVARAMHAASPEPLLCVRLFAWASRFGEQRVAQDRAVRRALVDALWRRGPVVLSPALVADLRACGCGVSEELLCALIESWGRLGLARYAHEVFVQMPRLGLERPTTSIYNAVIAASVRAGAVDAAYLRFQQMPADGCRPDRFTYNALVHGICRRGIVDEALRLVKQMEGAGIRPNVFTYTMLVDGFCNARRAEDALALLRTMKVEKGVAPSEATYRTLVHGVFKSLGGDRAYKMLSEWLETDITLHPSACHTLLYCLSKNGMVKEAVELVKKLGSNGYTIDNTSFRIVLADAVKCLELNDLLELVDGFIKRNGKMDFNMYIMIMKATLSRKDFSKANNYIHQMVQDGLFSSVVSYNTVIDCLVKAGATERGMELVKEMQEKGFPPNLVTFNTLINAYSKVGNVHEAKDVLKVLMEHGFKPDIVTFNSLIEGLCRTRQLDDAFDCFNEMSEWDVRPNARTYNLLIGAFCSAEQANKAVDLLYDMKTNGITPDANSFSAPILSFCRVGKTEKARKLLNAMLKSGAASDSSSCSTLIKALCDERRIDEAKEILLALESRGCIAADQLTYRPVVSTLTKMGRFNEAGELMNKFHRRKNAYAGSVSKVQTGSSRLSVRAISV